MRLLVLGVFALTGCSTFGIDTCSSDEQCEGGARCDLATGVCVQQPGAGGGGGGAIGSGGGGGGAIGNGGGAPGTGGGAAGGGGGGSAGGSGGGAAGGSAGGSAGGGGSGGGIPTTVSLVLPTVPMRAPAGGATYEDAPRAWRRNESIFVAIQSSRPLTNAQLTAGGVAAAPASCTAPCSGSCACFRVNLWLPPLAAMRGTFTLTASGTDPSGIAVTASAQLPVTRFNWSRTVVAGHQLRATPALGADGTLYVGTTAGPALRAGSLVAISPTGLEKWSKALGRIEGSVALSAPGPSQRIYVGAVETLGGRLYAFNTAGVQQGQCTLSIVSALEASPVILSSGGAAFYSNATRGLIHLLPGASCLTKSTSHDLSFPSNLVASGNTVYFADNQPRLRRFTLETDDDEDDREWKERTGGQWPAQLPAAFVTRSLALWSGTKLIGSGTRMAGGVLFQATVGNSVVFDFGVPPPPMSPSHQSPVVAAGGLALAGVPSGIAAISNGTSVAGAGDPIRNAPVLGQGGRLYALAENGSISQWTWSGTPSRTWTAALDSAPSPAFEASPTLDCARDAAGAAVPGLPGVLYAASRSGTLYSVIVDARGIDTSAAWPKYQKDPRNSGNSSTSLTEFSCP